MEENKQLYCSIRNTWIAATPEEYVRQGILKDLIEELGFPKAFIGVEKELRSIPHLARQDLLQLPGRRLDILCYVKVPEKLKPLLLIECKAVPFSVKEMHQVIGYNHLIKAPFIALVNQNEKKLGWFDQQSSEYKFINYIPSFLELSNSIIY